MRIGGAFRRLIAVESFIDQRPPRQTPPPPAPDAGARWGQPSAFEVGATPEPPGPMSITAGFLHEYRLFKGTESHREYAGVVALSEQAVTAEGIRSATFYLGEREVVREQREIDGSVTTVTPLIEAIREYVRLDFPFDAEGARGEPHPPETPPREEPDYG